MTLWSSSTYQTVNCGYILAVCRSIIPPRTWLPCSLFQRQTHIIFFKLASLHLLQHSSMSFDRARLRLYIPAYHWHWVATSTPPSLGIQAGPRAALSYVAAVPCVKLRGLTSG